MERQHSRSEQFRPCTAVLGAFEGLQPVDLAIGLAVAPRHFDGVSDSVDAPMKGSGKAHDGQQVCLDRVVDPGLQGICPTTAQNAVEPHGKASHRDEGWGAFLQGLNLPEDRKSTRLNSSHVKISYAVFCLKKKTKKN